MTMSESGDVLERFFEVLLHEITASRPEYLTGPFTVAEIYQDIVPYRSHRDLIGVEMSGDYEDALIRLLGGEGNYLLLDSAVAREELQKEVARPNPDTSLFREFAAVDVRLDPGRLPEGAGLEPEAGGEASEEDPIDTGVAGASAVQVDLEVEAEPKVEVEAESKAEEEPNGEEEPSVEEGSKVEGGARAEEESRAEESKAGEEPNAPEEEPPKAAEVGGVRQAEQTAATPGGVESVELLRPEPGGSSSDGVVGHIETASRPPLVSHEEPASNATASGDAEPRDSLTVCHWCREALPVRDSVHFCPFCGSDLRPSPCRECGEAMKALWQFCISCGADVRA